METVKTVKRGVSLDPETGVAQVPHENGVHTEIKEDGSIGFLFDDTPAARDLVAKLIEVNGLEAEAAAARGQKFNPTVGSRIKSIAVSNVTPIKMVAFVVAGGLTYWLGRKALAFLAQKMGWNLFGNVVMTEEEGPRRSAAPRRTTSSPTQVQASA